MTNTNLIVESHYNVNEIHVCSMFYMIYNIRLCNIIYLEKDSVNMRILSWVIASHDAMDPNICTILSFKLGNFMNHIHTTVRQLNSVFNTQTVSRCVKIILKCKSATQLSTTTFQELAQPRIFHVIYSNFFLWISAAFSWNTFSKLVLHFTHVFVTFRFSANEISKSFILRA